ncbi:hypothetical protein ACFVP3_30835 [Streptomyces sp. NPDC057806]|uniref:hypothetical protein n=1 Tax=unclassified Streptomyces TaxID=2593676 RepID=UPI003699119D
MAIGAGTGVAIESAGVVLASSGVRGVSGVITLSRAPYRKMIQNLAWAGVVFGPAVGALLMSVSTIVVALDARLLRRLDVTVDGQ